MNQKSIIQISMIVLLIIILYFLGTRISISVDNVRYLQENDISAPSPSPISSHIQTYSPGISRNHINNDTNTGINNDTNTGINNDTNTGINNDTKTKKNGILGPYGYVTKDMLKDMNQYPHKNPMMYKKKDRVFLDNISE